MKRFILKLLVSVSIGLMLAIGLNYTFLSRLIHAQVDRMLLMSFSTAAFGYLIFEGLGLREGMSISFKIMKNPLKGWMFLSFLREHLAGLLLAFLFFGIYTYIGLKLNLPIDTVDNFLDADNTSWAARIAAPQGYGMEMRGPHPFAYFLLRPLGRVFNLFTGNFLISAILINTMTGGLCVYLAWAFIRNHTGNKTYALMIASLLGLSTAHIFLGSVVESYIFSAAALIGFFLLLQTKKESMSALVAAGLFTFGITLTNFVQNFLGFVVSRPKIKDVIRFAGLTISLAVILSMLHAMVYPSSKLFFLPSNAQAEEEFSTSIFHEPAWRGLGRVILVVRTVVLYAVAAPIPYVFGKEVGGEFPRFNFFKIVPGTFSFSSYDGLGNVVIIMWSLLLLASGIFFIRDLLRTRKADMRLAFVLCVMFNFVLHLQYGYEPFLYSPDWAYALIFFVGLSLAPLAKNRFFMIGLLVFLVLLSYNQSQFLLFVFQTIAPFIGQG